MITITARSSSRAALVSKRRCRFVTPLELTGAVLLALSTACTTFEGLDVTKSHAVGDASSASQPCAHATVRPPPMIASLPGNREFVVAMSSVDFGEPGGGRVESNAMNIGFDLDGKCTGEGEGPSCRRPLWADDHPDGPEGRDNAAGSLIVAEDGGDAPAAKHNADLISAGLSTMMLRVSGYTGTRFDGSVDVEMFVVTRSPDPLNAAPNLPLWNGDDVWKAFVEWTEPDADGGKPAGSVRPKYQSDAAYVSDGVLVAHFDSLRLAAAYQMSDTWIQARLEDGIEGDDKWSLREGILAGRLRIDDSLSSVEFAFDPDTHRPTCMDSPGYPAAKRRVCALADIGYSGDDPSAPCDAESWAWSFEAEPAQLSGDVDLTRERDLRHCPPELSPANDHCSTLGPGVP